MNQSIQQFKADFFKALAHPMRIRILELLSDGDKTVNELQSILGSEGSAVSQQLAVLRSKMSFKGRRTAPPSFTLCVTHGSRICWWSPSKFLTIISWTPSPYWKISAKKPKHEEQGAPWSKTQELLVFCDFVILYTVWTDFSCLTRVEVGSTFLIYSNIQIYKEKKVTTDEMDGEI